MGIGTYQSLKENQQFEIFPLAPISKSLFPFICSGVPMSFMVAPKQKPHNKSVS